MGLLNRANKLTGKKYAGNGLLNHTLNYLQQKSGKQQLPADITSPLKPLADELDKNIGNIASITDLINYLAASYIKLLKLKKISCLMYDPVKDCYAPWVSIGFINNFSSQIEISAEDLKKLVTPGKSSRIEVNQFPLLADHLTGEAGSSPAPLTLIPFPPDNLPVGILLIPDLPAGYARDADFPALLRHYPRFRALVEERGKRIEQVTDYNYPQNLLQSEVEKHLEYAQQNKTVFCLLKLSLPRCIAPVMENNPTLNNRLLQEEVLLLLGQLCKHIGYLYNMQNGQLLFAINKLRQFDLKILNDQLQKTLERYFSEQLRENSFRLDFEVFPYPGKGESAEELLASCFEPDEHLS